MSSLPGDTFSVSRLGLVLLAGLLIFSPLLEGGTTHFAVMIIRLMILSLVGIFLVRVLLTGRVAIAPLGLGASVPLFIGLAVGSVFFSPYTHQSVQWLMVLVSYAALLYMQVSFARTWEQMTVLLVVMLGMGIVEAGMAFVEVWWLGTTRPHGTFFNPNFLGGYLASLSMIVLGHLLYLPLKQYWTRILPWWEFVAPLVLLGGLLMAVLLTESRGACLALAAGISYMAVARFGSKGLLVPVLILVGLILFPNPLRARIIAEHAMNPVGYARWQIWESAVKEMGDHPGGIGLGLYQYVYPRYMIPVEGSIARYGTVAHGAHNEYLQMGVELGIASVFVFAWGVWHMGRQAVELIRARLQKWQRGIALGLCGAIVTILVHAAVDSNLHEPAIVIQLVSYAGFLVMIGQLACKASDEVPVETQHTRARLLGAGGLVAVVGLAVWVIQLGMAWSAFETGSRALADGDRSQAIRAYERAIVMDSRKALYHSALASVRFQQFEESGDQSLAGQAVAELQEAIRLNPMDGRLQALLGHVYETRALSHWPATKEDRYGWLRAAYSTYRQAGDLEPYSALHQFSLGRVADRLGDGAAAESSMRMAVTLEPNFLPAREWLARRYLDSDRRVAALQEVQEILQRQQKYLGWQKGPLEMQFLRVDSHALQSAVRQEGLHGG